MLHVPRIMEAEGRHAILLRNFIFCFEVNITIPILFSITHGSDVSTASCLLEWSEVSS